MLQRILWVCSAAGLAAGLVLFILQTFLTTPLILKAEEYEHAKPQAQASLSLFSLKEVKLVKANLRLIHGDGSHGEQNEEANEYLGQKRHLFTLLASIAIAIGYGLMLFGAMFISNASIHWRSALCWACGGFAAFQLAPSLGLPPELPGAAGGALMAKQIWWLIAVSASALGLWLIFHHARWVSIISGLLLLLVPHIYGAPYTVQYISPVPAELAAEFFTASLMTQLMMWITLGLMIGWLWQRGESQQNA